MSWRDEEEKKEHIEEAIERWFKKDEHIDDSSDIEVYEFIDGVREGMVFEGRFDGKEGLWYFEDYYSPQTRWQPSEWDVMLLTFGGQLKFQMNRIKTYVHRPFSEVNEKGVDVLEKEDATNHPNLKQRMRKAIKQKENLEDIFLEYRLEGD